LLGEELLARARAEARGNRVTFDLIDVGSQWPDYKKLGLLGNESDVLNAAGLPPETHRGGMLVDDLNVTGAAYNSNVLKPEDLPKTWDDFLDPKWKGKFGLEERLRPFVYFTPFWGEEKVVAYLEKLKTQNPRIERGDTRNATLMLAGEIQFYIGAALGTITEMEGKPWAFMPLDEVVSVDQVGGFTIPPQAKHPNAAKLYLWWYANPKEGGVLRDKLRFRSDPRPGSGTGVSKYLEERHMKLLMAPEKWDLDQEEWTSKYAKVLGLPG
jgi:iron(III) transport system substrate-binding protein